MQYLFVRNSSFSYKTIIQMSVIFSFAKQRYISWKNELEIRTGSVIFSVRREITGLPYLQLYHGRSTTPSSKILTSCDHAHDNIWRCLLKNIPVVNFLSKTRYNYGLHNVLGTLFYIVDMTFICRFCLTTNFNC
jgi:hypothetical protein